MKKHTFRPTLEALEGRDCPSSTWVNSATGGAWNAPGSWVRTGGTGGPGYPISGDSVTITGGTGGAITNNSGNTGELASLTITGSSLTDKDGVTADAFSISGGNVTTVGMSVGQFTMTGGEIDADPTNGCTLTVDESIGSGSHDSSWTAGVIGGTTTKGSFNCEPNLTFGQRASTLGFDMQLGYGGTGSTNTYQASTTTLSVTNNAYLSINNGATLNLTQLAGANDAGRTIDQGSGSGQSYLYVAGTLEDKILGSAAGPADFTILPLYVASGGTVNVDGSASTNPGAWLHIDNQTTGTSPPTQGYGIYQNDGTVNIDLGGTAGGTTGIQADYGYYQAGGVLNVTGFGGVFKGGSAAGNGLYINNKLTLDPTQSSTLWGDFLVSNCQMQFGSSSTFEFCVNAAAGGYSQMLLDRGQIYITSGATYLPHLLGTGTTTTWSQVIDVSSQGGSWASGSANFTDPMGWTGSSNAKGWDLKKN